MIKKGDRLICINSGYECLTKGKLYIALLDSDGSCTQIINDEGKKFGYYDIRFKKYGEVYGIVKFTRAYYEKI